MFIYVLALLIGVVAGLRAMTAPAAVAWAAYLGWINLDGSWLSFLSHWLAPLILTLLAIVELITDQLPSTPSRKVPPQFGARIVMGALAGITLGATGGQMIFGLIAGIIGAVIGTFGGATLRGKLALSLGSDRPAAIIEDIVAIGGALLIVHNLL